MKKAIFTVRFWGGEGGTFFFGEGIPHGFQITSANGDVQSFQAMQVAGFKNVSTSGVAPSDGSIEIQVTNEVGKILSPFEQNKYPAGPFMGSIFYNL